MRPLPKAVMGSAGSYPAITSSSSAASVTVRVIGPTSCCVRLFGMTPDLLTRPRVGRTPTRLLAEAGERIGSPGAVPGARTAKFTPDAGPGAPAGPPGVRRGSLRLGDRPTRPQIRN